MSLEAEIRDTKQAARSAADAAKDTHTTLRADLAEAHATLTSARTEGMRSKHVVAELEQVIADKAESAMSGSSVSTVVKQLHSRVERAERELDQANARHAAHVTDMQHAHERCGFPMRGVLFNLEHSRG
jgi:predicted  nucleic acid-binding Zn-ribbon protein